LKNYWAVLEKKKNEDAQQMLYGTASYQNTEHKGSAEKAFADVAVAWEVDNSSNPQKSIKSSIENLDRINPRLGLEPLLVGTSVRSKKKI
jgi:hypothetical protein